jgi:hypothetical protein
MERMVWMVWTVATEPTVYQEPEETMALLVFRVVTEFPGVKE